MARSVDVYKRQVATIKHYIGEMYFLRAYEYFKPLKTGLFFHFVYIFFHVVKISGANFSIPKIITKFP